MAFPDCVKGQLHRMLSCRYSDSVAMESDNWSRDYIRHNWPNSWLTELAGLESRESPWKYARQEILLCLNCTTIFTILIQN